MTTDDWENLVRRRARQAKSDPRAYRRHVAAWALGGYGALLGAFALAIAAVGGLVAAVVAGRAPVLTLKLGIPVLVVAWIVARSLLVRIPPPAGIELRAADAPALFATIERLCAALDTPRVHHVLLDADFNASVVQIPRLGALGSHRNYLTLGIACMQALAPPELEAVLAHELGHISRSHGRFGVWIYRVRNSWASVARELDDGGLWGAGVARRFYGWYVPRLQACSVALVREHEHEADRAAADAAGAGHAARALVRMSAAAPAVGAYWDSVFARVPDEPAPPRDAFRGLMHALRGRPAAEGMSALRRALATPTDPADSHPALAERLAALGVQAEVLDLDGALQSPTTSAADALLGRDAHAALCERLSGDWYDATRAGWADRHAAAAGERLQLHDLDVRAAAGTLDVAAARERAALSDGLCDGESALAAWRAVLALDPADAHANLVVGARLLRRDDDAGLRHIDRVLCGPATLAVRAAEIGHGYLAGHGRHDEAARYRTVKNAQLDALDAAVAERRGLTCSDELEPHDLPAEAVAAITGSLARIGRIAHAYVVRKRVEHLADDVPLYVVAVERVTTWWRPERSNADQRLLAQVVEEVSLPGEILAIALAKPTRWLRRRLKRMDGALVYGR